MALQRYDGYAGGDADSNPALIVVQRERLEEVMREQALQVSGRVDDESMVRLGRLTGATLLVTGSISVVENRLRLDAQLSGVEQEWSWVPPWRKDRLRTFRRSPADC